MRLRCEWAWLGGPQAQPDVLLEVDGDRIVGVGVAGGAGSAAAGEDVERLPGLTIPGLVNAHSHAFHRALRSRTQAGTGSFWTWRDQMYRMAATLTPDSYQLLAAATFAEMALAGITTVGEFHYLHHGPGGQPYDDPNAMGHALLAAATEAGLRMTLLDTCYLHGGIGLPPNEVQQRFSDGDAERWAGRATAVGSSATVRAGAAVHSVRAVAPEEMGLVGEWADQRGAPLHAHVSEQPAENEDCTAAYGRTPVEVLAAGGLVGGRFTAVHATHLTPTDVTALGVASVCFCPTTERDLADGIGPSAALVATGAGLCLGSDSHAVVDGHHTAADLLAAATSGGARSLGWADAGHLGVGALADLTVVGLDGVRLAGAAPDHLVEAAVFAAGAPDVRHVMVGGRWIVRDGEHVSVPVPIALAEAVDAVWTAA